MKGVWWVNGLLTRIMLVLIVFFQLNSMFCWSLNDEGIALLKFKERVVSDPYDALSSWIEEIGETDHCLWFGIECADGHVVSLNLKNLCLEGTLAPELHHLMHIKSIILRNNSFYGFIPEEFRDLKELEFLDLGYNNLTEPFVPEYGYNIPILFLDNNGLSCHMSPEREELILPSEAQVDESYWTSSKEVFPDNSAEGDKLHLTFVRHYLSEKDTKRSRMLAEKLAETPPTSTVSTENSAHVGPPGEEHVSGVQSPPGDVPASPSIAPKQPKSVPTPILESPPPPKDLSSPRPPSPRRQPPVSPPTLSATSPPRQSSPVPPTPVNGLSPPPSLQTVHVPSSPPVKQKAKNMVPVVVGAVSGFIGLILVIGLYLWAGKKFRKGGPQTRGLSGQLQKALVAGIQNLKRSELETACEDFSNVIGTCSIGTIYKGTLSNGVEIAVVALAALSAKDWSKNLETQFRKKIETLSKVNHKNFINLIGYCEEEEPFSRMMVFEYAPNGSLFEHLHVREAEHLDWGMRLRVAMGMAYCLEHMHQLAPPVTHPNLNSSAVNLSEDYAAKMSDFCFWNEVAAGQVQPIGLANLSTSPSTLESNVYSFGSVLLEMMTGRIPHVVDSNNSVEDWVLEYLKGEKPLQELVDPMLRHFNPEQLEKISEVIRNCLHSDPKLRPTVKDVTARLREITGINQDKALPLLSPFWWTELEGR